MKKRKKQEKRKKKLKTLILLLFLTIIMFGTSTYAWFTANKVVTINSLDVKVNATGGIQISTDGANWKSVITNSDIKNGYNYNDGAIVSVNQVPEIISDVSTDTTVTEAGRLNMYSSIIENDTSTGNYMLKTALETDTGQADGKAGETGKYIAFDIFLRLDSEQTVYLTPTSNVLKKGDEDKGLKNATRVAFVELGHTTSSATPEEIVVLNNGTSSDVVLWEPHVDAHSSTVINSVAPDYGVPLTEIMDGENHTGLYNDVNYWGINTVISEAKNLKQMVNGSLTGISSYATSMTSRVDIKTKETNAEYKTFKNAMPAGVTKYRVYMWIEGQDIDCENNATGSDITFNVQLSTTNTATPETP